MESSILTNSQTYGRLK